MCLSRDLQSDFYAFFRVVLNALIDLLDSTDTELLEQVFVALSHLFKSLQKPILKDLGNVFKYERLSLCFWKTDSKLIASLSLRWYFPLLSHAKEFVASFAAESFSYLMRKVSLPKVPQLIEAVFGFVEQVISAETRELYRVALSHLFFEMMKGVKGHLFSKSPQIISNLIGSLSRSEHGVSHGGWMFCSDKVDMCSKRNFDLRFSRTSCGS